MILLEDRNTGNPNLRTVVEVYTYNMVLRFRFNNCVVQCETDNNRYVITSIDTEETFGAFPMTETAYILKTPETTNLIQQEQ